MPLSVGACSAFWGTECTECSRLHVTQMVPQLKHIVYVPRETLGPWFVYHSTLFLLLGISVKCSNRPIFKLHLSNTWLLSYQLRIPVITSAMFAFWIYHFRIFVRFSLFLKPSAERVLYTNFIVYCQFLLQSLYPPLSFPVLWRFHSFSVPLHFPSRQPHLRKSYFPFSPALMRCKPGEKFISGCSLDDPASGWGRGSHQLGMSLHSL